MAGSVDLGSVYATLELRDKGFAEAIQKAADRANDSFRRLNSNLSSSLTRTGDSFISMGDRVSSAGQQVAGLASTIGGPLFKVTAVAGAGLGFMAKSAFGMAREVENARLNLTTFTGSAEKASDITKELIAYATSDKGVLFNRAELLNSAQNMALFGVETSKLTRNTQILSKAVALGKFSFADLDMIIGRVLATGKLAGNEFDELKKAGIDLDPALRNASVSAEQLFQAIDKGVDDSVLSDRVNTIDGQMIRLRSAFQIAGAAILGLDRETGKFVEGGAGQKFMQLIAEITTQLKSPEGIKSLQSIGNTIAQAFRTVISVISPVVKFVGQHIEQIIKVYLAWLGFWVALKVLAPVLSLIGGLLKTVGFLLKAIGLGLRIVKMVQAFVALSKAIGIAKAAMLVFNAAMLANPAGVILVAIVAIGAALFLLQKRFNIFGKMKEGFDKLYEAAKPVRDFIANQLTSALDSLKSIWSQFVTAMQPVIDIFKEFWSKHGDKVMTVLKVIGAVVAAIVLGPLIAGFALFLAGLKVVSVVLGFVSRNFDTIKKVVLTVMAVALSPLIIAIGLVVGAFLLLRAGIRFIISVFQSLWSGIVTVFTAIWAFLLPILTTIWTFFTTIFNAIWAVISFVLELIKNLFIIVFGSILIVILTVMNFIWNTIMTVWNAIWGFLQPIIQAIVDFLTERWENIKTNVTNAFNAVWTFITNIWNKIYETISGIVQRVIDFFAPALSWLYEKGKAIIQGLINGIKNLAQSVWNKVKEIGDSIGNFFSGAATWLFDAGKAIFQGLIDGMKNIGNKVKETAEGIVKKVRDLLPFSPAKEGPFSGKGWTLYSGRALMSGFAEGISDMSGPLRKSVINTLGEVDALANANITPSLNANLALQPSRVDNQNSGNKPSPVAIYGNVNIRNGQEENDFLGMNQMVQDQLNVARGMAV